MIGGGPQKITVEIGGKIAASLGKALRESQRQVSTFGRNVNRSMNDAAIAGKKGFKGIFDNALWQQATIGATAFASAIGLSVREAMKFDSAMADVRKAITFKDGTGGAKRFGRELIKLSTVLPYTAEQLTKIAASAGFAGYAEKDIIPFTKSAAAMGVAFQMTAEDAGDAMVAMRASMGLTQPEVQQLGDAINYLSDKFQGTVNAADLVEVTRRIGAIGKASGLAKEEIAGLGAAFLASGTPVEVAGTGLKNFLNALTKGDQATKKQVEALEAIFGSDVSGKLAKGMQKDAEGTIKSVIQGMAKLSPDKRVSVAGALFGEESKAAIMPLLTNTKLLAQAFDLIADKTAFAGSMQKEFENQMGTSAAQAKIFQNGVQAVGISVGTALLPSLNSILKTVTPLLIRFGEWAQKNEGLVTTIVLIGGALSGLVIALPIIAGVIGAIGTIGTAIGAVTAAFPALAGIGTVIAVAGGPITLIIAGVVLLGIAIHSLIKNWDSVKAATAGAWQGVVATWGKFTGWIGNVFNQALGVIRAWGSKVLGVMRAIPTMIISMFTGSNLGQRIMTSIIDGLKAKAGALFGWIRNTWSNITGFFGGGAAPAPVPPGGAAPARAPSGNPPAGQTGIYGTVAPPGRALGGPVTAGMPYIVGEKRRELFVPGMDGAIIPRVARPAAAPRTPQITAPAAAAPVFAPQITASAAATPKTPPININSPVARQAPTPAPITINAPVTINATGDGAGIRDQVRAAFEDLMAMASSGYRVALND